MTAFDIVEFQPVAWRMISRSFQSGHLTGTYLLTGPDGSGRWALAIAMAALINCEQPVTLAKSDNLVVPCGTCRNCRMITTLNFEGLYIAVPLPSHKSFEDAIELTNAVLEVKRTDPFASLSTETNVTIPIAVARQIKKHLASRPPDGLRRVVLFHQMERMREASADALLKMIEEPPADTIILLTAEKPERLLSTIQSRSMPVRLRPIEKELMADFLSRKYELQEGKARVLAQVSQGNIGTAIAMIDSYDDGQSFRIGIGFQLFRSLIEDPAPTVVGRIVDKIGPRNLWEAEELLRLWQSFIRDCAGLAVAGDVAAVTNSDLDIQLRRLSTWFVSPQLAGRMTERIKFALADLRRNVHIHGALAALTLRIKSDMSNLA